MSKTDQNAIQQAEKVIAKFGGIRPMASKMSVPVTTVQGWKKRNVIPESRLDDLLKAAEIHDIDLDGLVWSKSEAANENAQSRVASSIKVPRSAVEIQKVQSQKTENVEKAAEKSDNEKGDSAKDTKKSAEKPPILLENDLAKQFEASEKKAVTKATIINAILIVLAIGAVAALLWPQSSGNTQKISALENEVLVVEKKQSVLNRFLPANMEERMSAMQEQTRQAQESIEAAMKKAEEISGDVLGESAGSLEERMVKLEAHITELTGSPVLAGLMSRVQGLQGSTEGQAQLSQSVSELGALLSGLGGQNENLNGALEKARGQSEALEQTFENVPQQDLKAAALLFSLSQLRNSLHRDNAAFDDDLEILMNLVGEDNVELKASLERLAPHAQVGVLTPEGLSQEFRGLAGDIVVSSLKGEEIDVQEKARARFNEAFSPEKDAELLKGADTQAKVARAQILLDEGNIEAAIVELQSLEGPPADTAESLIEDAIATLLAQQASNLAGQTINLQVFGTQGLSAEGVKNMLGGALGTGSQLIRDEKTGITILKPGLLNKPNIKYR